MAIAFSTPSSAAAGGTLTGTVTDPKGATIADAVVSVIDPVSNQTSTAATDSQGKYKLEGLPPGTYAVTVTAKGFRDARRENVKIEEDKSTLADFKLDLAVVESAVTVATAVKANTEATYRQLRKNADESGAFSGNVFTVNNLVLKKDAATFTLKSGELYFLAPVEGRVTGAVFLGDGELTLIPPTESEKSSLAIFIDDKVLTEQFNELVLRFTDKTFEELKASPNASPNATGSQAGKARDAYRDKQSLMRKQLRTNLDLRTLMDVYSPKLPGYFLAFINGKRYSKLIYRVDPLGLAEVPPEEVALISYGTQDGGVWTSFHLAGEYATGRALSSQDHRVFDITHHEIETQIKGAEIIATDRISFVALSSRRVLPFSLYPSLRVKTVKDEQGKELDFVQEAKEEDGDFGVILPAPMQSGKSYVLSVSYQGGDALADLGGGNYFLIPRESWYPSNAGALFGDRAIFDVTVRYPRSNVFVGTGAPVGAETEEADARVAKWSSGATELAVAGFNYGKFKKKELDDKESGYGIEFYANTQLAPDMKQMEDQIKIAEMVTGENIENLTGGEIRSNSGSTTKGGDLAINSAQNALRIYNSYFGRLPYTRVAMTQQPAGNFGQAWPTLVYMPYTAFLDPTQRHNLFGSSQAAGDSFWQYVGPHEVAHQWWGHVVGWSSYRDQWMSEGFAEFSASLWVQQVKGIGKFISFWEEQRKMIVDPQVATKGRKPYTIGPITAGYRLNTGKTGGAARFLIYPKGAYALHMLRMLMYDSRDKTGDPDARFKAMMQDFVKTYFNQDASTEDFKRVVEKHMTPEMDLDGNRRMDWFFNQWVYGTEVPAYKFEYSLSSSDGKTVLSGRITQSGVSDKFRMRVPVWVDFGKGWVRLGAATLVGDSSLDLPQIPLAQQPKKVAIAALNDVLATDIQTNKR
ncbi:MAG TPA: carboxypeptidase regulatory-like domain-containing protein [Pyrinomonadaceae bacterium]|nr:carboxypeptidase regulatory-like domain-containing protein [Pyrinomonadaceae bacterium]